MDNGDLYYGEILHARPHGQGTLIKKDGTIFEGIFAWGDLKWGSHFYWDKRGTVIYDQGRMVDF
jgi:hypothetical protein